MRYQVRFIPEAQVLEARLDPDHGLSVWPLAAIRQHAPAARQARWQAALDHPWTWCDVEEED